MTDPRFPRPLPDYDRLRAPKPSLGLLVAGLAVWLVAAVILSVGAYYILRWMAS